MPVDLETFKPESGKELYDALVEAALGVAGSEWKKINKEVRSNLNFISSQTIKTSLHLAQGKISQKEADLSFHMLEYNINSALLQVEFLQYVLAQKIRNAIMNVLRSVLRNYTGVDLDF